MIRARNALRSDAACHSADVLTPTERAVEVRMRHGPESFAAPEALIYRNAAMRWGDVPEIRALLMTLRGKS
jgi:hypothetical protein